MRRNRIDFNAIKVLSSPRLLDILRTVSPCGKIVAHEYVALAPCRGDSTLGSFKYNIRSNAWSDFATGVAGNDIIGYVAYALTISPLEAANRIQAICGGGYNQPLSVAVSNKHMVHAPIAADDEFKAITPIPDHITIASIPVPLSRRVITSPYVNADGKLMFVVIRSQDNKGLPWGYFENRYEKSAWQCKHPVSNLRPLLNLPKIINNENKSVILVEGEKACIAAEKLFPNMVCSTWCGGSNAVHKTCFKPLKGKHIVLWPDCDKCGREAMQYVSKAAIQAGALSVSYFPIMALTQSYVIKDGRIANRIDNFVLANGFDAADLIETEYWTADLLNEVLDSEFFDGGCDM